MTAFPVRIPEPPQILDTKGMTGRIGRMIRRLIESAMRNTIQELVTPHFVRIEERFQLIDKRFDLVDQRFEQMDRRFGQIDQRFEQIDQRFEQVDLKFERIDRRFEQMDQRITGLGERLDHRIDGLSGRIEELTQQQGRIIESVAALKRDRESAENLVHRVTRLEDRFLAGAS